MKTRNMAGMGKNEEYKIYIFHLFILIIQSDYEVWIIVSAVAQGLCDLCAVGANHMTD
jgi:hypothetical protein